MAIVWGRKQVEKSLGYAVDFCPICREITPFMISRLGVAGHIYYVPLGEGKLVGHVGECSKCKTKKLVNSMKYRAFLFAPGNDIEKLIVETYPAIRSDYAERLGLERKIREHHIFSEQEREVLLMEPFKVLSGRVEERYANAKFDKESGFGCFSTILLMVMIGCFSMTTSPSGSVSDILSMSGGLIFCLGLIYTVIQLMLAPGRFIKREVVPVLAKALLPLHPKQAEVAKCLNVFKVGGHRLGQKISEQQLWEQIQKFQTL